MCFWFRVSERVGTLRWYRVINTVKMKKHPGLTGRCGSNVQSVEGNLQEQRGRLKAEGILSSKSQRNCWSWGLGP